MISSILLWLCVHNKVNVNVVSHILMSSVCCDSLWLRLLSPWKKGNNHVDFYGMWFQQLPHGVSVIIEPVPAVFLLTLSSWNVTSLSVLFAVTHHPPSIYLHSHPPVIYFQKAKWICLNLVPQQLCFCCLYSMLKDSPRSSSVSLFPNFSPPSLLLPSLNPSYLWYPSSVPCCHSCYYLLL